MNSSAPSSETRNRSQTGKKLCIPQRATLYSRATMERLFAKYGTAIGPTVAFILGVVALFIKNGLEDRFKRVQITKRFEEPKRLIERCSPPRTFHPREAPNGLHADKARNIANLARFYNRIIAKRTLIEVLEKNIYEYADLTSIRQFNNIRWRHAILVSEVEQI